jgi:glycosyltransferase involved in cell wall biosynthesis
VNRPKVSVCIITYNHEAYIADCIDSVLKQETDFAVEIRVGEDDSTDRTREIVKAYDEKYDNVVGLYRDKADKIYIDGRPTGRFNFTDNLLNAGGEYIALLDGDDYWIDDRKLAKQVALLDANPDASFCFHRIYDESDDGERSIFPRESRCREAEYGVTDLLKDNFVPTASVVFRNRDLVIPDWFMRVPFGDWPLHILNAEKGKVLFIDEIMAVRRDHGMGSWSAMDASIQDFNKIRMLCAYLENLDAAYRPLILAGLLRTQKRIIRHAAKHQGPRAAIAAWKRINETSCRKAPAVPALLMLLQGTIRSLLRV